MTAMNRQSMTGRMRVAAVGVVVAAVLVTLGSSISAQRPAGADAGAPPRLTFAFELRAQVAAPTEVGEVAHGRRRIVQITGGTFEGPGIKGKVLPGGADWQMIQPDGFSELDTRYTLETDKGQIIYVQNAGVRHAPPDVMTRLLAGEAVDPSLVYFRTVPTFETSAPELQWLARTVFVGTGERYPSDVRIRFWRVE